MAYRIALVCLSEALLLCCRHPLLQADYLTWKEASARQEQRPASSARRLANRKDVMAHVPGNASDVSLRPAQDFLQMLQQPHFLSCCPDILRSEPSDSAHLARATSHSAHDGIMLHL